MSDVIVVGAGLIGASVARRLADRGASVSVIEADRAAGGTSLGTFAWINAVGKQPRSYFDLNMAGIEEHARLVDELRPGDWYHGGGNLEWSARADELEAKIAKHRSWGYRVERIDAARARALEPDLLIDDAVAVALYPDDGWIDPGPLVARLLRHDRMEVIGRAEVAEITSNRGRVTGVRLTDGRRLNADAVVISTGARAAELARTVGFELPMRHAPGLLAITEPAPIGVTHILHAAGLAARPDGGGRLMLASDGLDKQIEPSGGATTVADAAAELLNRAVDLMPRLGGVRIESMRIGRRALTGDGLPAIGELPGCSGAYLAVTHSGVTLAPLVGRLVAAELSGDGPDQMLEEYRPGRFID